MLPILVVDDQVMIRRTARRILEAAGYPVLEAPDGQAAWSMLLEQRDAIGLVLTDLMMPRMSGIELGRLIQDRWPDLPIICMTGFHYEAAAARGILRPDIPFLDKPFDTPELLRSVAARLAAGEADSVSEA